ncbi:hypothetical protein POTOM_059589 [Populus tomentosa]|uniref:GAG-pre-integrase domain-containing protein n=1 Tax=Populus tomentosa TaxID=118781 RepID=A0A8X8C282_POPTO|nr:hypothetical protein POTOM_059589 [Populus tomentosa]
MGDNHALEISGIGTIKLKMYDGLIRTISGVRHVKDLKKNLLSVGQFDSLGCKIRTHNGIMKIVKGALVVLKARKTVANMFVLMGETHQGAEASIASASPAEEKTMMWHQKLGHMSEKGLKVLSDQKLLPGLTKVTLSFCEHCVTSKQHRLKFGTLTTKSKCILDLIHFDVCILKETTEVQMENTQNRTSSEAAPEHEEQEQIESETPEVRRSTLELLALLVELLGVVGITCGIIAYGHSNVIKVLIDRAKALPTDSESGVTEAKKMLRMTTEEQDTALHEAARNRRSHVVEILTKEDPEFSYSANVHGETPLYITASIGLWTEERGKVVDEILGNSISVDYGGPKGRTALHAAIMVGDDETARKLLDKGKKLTKTTGFRDSKKVTTSLRPRPIVLVQEIVSGCPACCELVDNRGVSDSICSCSSCSGAALEEVAGFTASKRIHVFEECLKIPELARIKAKKDDKVFVQCLEDIPLLARLEKKKDDKGNTPFHLIAALAHEQKQWRPVLDEYSEGEIYGLNKRKLSVNDIYEGYFAEIQVINPL